MTDEEHIADHAHVTSDAHARSGAHPAGSDSAGVGGQMLHWFVVCVVFALTGSLSLKVSQLVLRDLLGLEGSFWGGPWLYRVAYLVLIPPAYSALLALIGTLLGKGSFFRSRVKRMWRRLLPSRVANSLFGPPDSTPI